MAESRRLRELAAGIDLDLPAGPAVVALSGGADSAALLWLCVDAGHPVRAVHVHHGRPASDRLESAAAAVAEALGVEVEVRRVEVPAGASYEARAREVRYAELEAAAGEAWILTGHTADDQAETVLAHLLRSSGPDGLAGIPARRGRLLRPLLAVTRSQTRELATLAGLPWVDDPENEMADPLRNRIRHRLIPALEAEFNPRLRRSLATSARLLAAEASYLEDRSAVAIGTVPGGIALPAAVVTTAPSVLAARMVRRFLARAGVPPADEATVAAVLAVAAGKIRRHQLGVGVEIRREGALLVASSAPAEVPRGVELAVPGVTRFGQWLFHCSVGDLSPSAMPIGAGWMVADADRLGPLRVEPAVRYPGVARHLTTVPSGERAGWPVLVSDGEPVWLPYGRRLPLGWVWRGTRRYLVVRSERSEPWHR